MMPFRIPRGYMSLEVDRCDSDYDDILAYVEWLKTELALATLAMNHQAYEETKDAGAG